MEIKSSELPFQTETITLPDENNLFVIVGANNSGKSTFLREVVKSFPDISYRVDVNRTVLKGEGAQDKNYERDFTAYVNNFRDQKDDNTEKGLQTL